MIRNYMTYTQSVQVVLMVEAVDAVDCITPAVDERSPTNQIWYLPSAKNIPKLGIP